MLGLYRNRSLRRLIGVLLAATTNHAQDEQRGNRRAIPSSKRTFTHALEPSCQGCKLGESQVVPKQTIGLGVFSRNQRALCIHHLKHGALAVHVTQVGKPQALACVDHGLIKRGKLPASSIGFAVGLSQIGQQPALSSTHSYLAGLRANARFLHLALGSKPIPYWK